jgi:hypothetical protein
VRPRPIENPVWLDRVVDALSDGTGIWYPLVKRGTYVQEGMKIGLSPTISANSYSKPVSGVIFHINAVPPKSNLILTRKQSTVWTRWSKNF